LQLEKYVAQINDWARSKGWWDGERPLGDIMVNIHSELSEAWEEFRAGKPVSRVYFSVDDKGNSKPEGFPIEIADTLIRIFDLCGQYNIDIENAIEMKMNYNYIGDWRHGGKLA
jgi:NTP pyrophosphatase (non-canonical NTP hydrolase)